MYLITSGKYYNDGYPKGYAKTKKEAESFLRGLGFHYNKRQNLFLSNRNPNNDHNGYWAKIEPLEHITEVWWPKTGE